MADLVKICCLFATGAVADGSVALCFLVLGAVEGEGIVLLWLWLMFFEKKNE